MEDTSSGGQNEKTMPLTIPSCTAPKLESTDDTGEGDANSKFESSNLKGEDRGKVDAVVDRDGGAGLLSSATAVAVDFPKLNDGISFMGNALLCKARKLATGSSKAGISSSGTAFCRVDSATFARILPPSFLSHMRLFTGCSCPNLAVRLKLATVLTEAADVEGSLLEYGDNAIVAVLENGGGCIAGTFAEVLTTSTTREESGVEGTTDLPTVVALIRADFVAVDRVLGDADTGEKTVLNGGPLSRPFLPKFELDSTLEFVAPRS